MRVLLACILGILACSYAEEVNEDTIRDYLAGHIEGEELKRSVMKSSVQSVGSLAKSFAANMGQAVQVGSKMSSGFNSHFTDTCLKGDSHHFNPIIRPFPWRPGGPITITRRAPKQVNNRDYIFVLDTSGSIPDDQFEKAKKAISTLVESFCPSSFGSAVTSGGNKQVAVVMFGTKTTLEISFDDSHKGLGYIKDKINSLRHRKDGGTSTAEALKYVNNNILGKGTSRINKDKVSTDIIVVTDGRCNMQCTKLGVEADGLRTKGNGANVFALGIANSRSCELEIISGKGDGLAYGLGDFQEFDKFAVAVSEIAKENKEKKCA